ncbi:glycine cleavage system protein GcvH [Desulfosporosinus sp. FKA]|uniref:glycine cleavage system protein GcvH n=1 Tax=Desulfosporosinus sp. FKA TaxID=1969834 RepID=UPI000B4A528D|nr:glycine cleavage system protein GcvH [Desulfosporosinus sp. FKA]
MSDKKGLEELTLLEDLRYDQEHAWARVKGDNVIVGISDFAQDQLGDIVFLELPNVGEVFEKGDVFGQAESVKSVSALYVPIGGEIVAVNEELADSPDTVNKQPYEAGWMVELKPNDLSEIEELLTKEDYLSYLRDSESI